MAHDLALAGEQDRDLQQVARPVVALAHVPLLDREPERSRDAVHDPAHLVAEMAAGLAEEGQLAVMRRASLKQTAATVNSVRTEFMSQIDNSSRGPLCR